MAKAVFATGCLLAAFGVASCCALPVALSLLGIGTASLVGIGYLAAQHQQTLFYGAVVLLAAAAVALAVGLLALTFWIEPPV